MVYGLWCMVHGSWFMVYGLWFMVDGFGRYRGAVLFGGGAAEVLERGRGRGERRMPLPV